MANWLSAVIPTGSQVGAYNPPKEWGVDVQTPFHSEVTNVLPGTVERVYNSPWGENVVIKAQYAGQTVNEYFQHLDTLASNLTAGVQVAAGQFLGLSGGETQAQVQAGMFPGAQSPNNSQYSSGPHTEFGIGAPWQGGGPNFNPVPLLQSYIANHGTVDPHQYQPLSNMGAPGCTSSDPCLGCGPKGSAAYNNCLAASFGTQGIGAMPACASCGTTNVQDAANAVAQVWQQWLQSLVPGLQLFATTQALPYIAGAILIIIGLLALVRKPLVETVKTGGKAAAVAV